MEKPIQKRHEEIENKYLEDDEYAKILAYCDKHNRQDLKDLFIWLYNTGMRCGEAIALQKRIYYKTKMATTLLELKEH